MYVIQSELSAYRSALPELALAKGTLKAVALALSEVILILDAVPVKSPVIPPFAFMFRSNTTLPALALSLNLKSALLPVSYTHLTLPTNREV